MSDVPSGPARSSLPCLSVLVRELNNAPFTPSPPRLPRCLPPSPWLRKARSSEAERHRHVRCHTRWTSHAPRAPRLATGTHYKSIALIQQRKYPEPRPEGRHVRFLYSAVKSCCEAPLCDVQPRGALVRTCAVMFFAHLIAIASVWFTREAGAPQCHQQAGSGCQSNTRTVTSLDWCRCVPLFVNYFPA